MKILILTGVIVLNQSNRILSVIIREANTVAGVIIDELIVFDDNNLKN